MAKFQDVGVSQWEVSQKVANELAQLLSLSIETHFLLSDLKGVSPPELLSDITHHRLCYHNERIATKFKTTEMLRIEGGKGHNYVVEWLRSRDETVA